MNDSTIFQPQTTKVGDQFLNIFFDSDCGDMVIGKSVVDVLMQSGHTALLASGPITYSGVGDKNSSVYARAYSVRLP